MRALHQKFYISINRILVLLNWWELSKVSAPKLNLWAVKFGFKVVWKIFRSKMAKCRELPSPVENILLVIISFWRWDIAPAILLKCCFRAGFTSRLNRFPLVFGWNIPKVRSIGVVLAIAPAISFWVPPITNWFTIVKMVVLSIVSVCVPVDWWWRRPPNQGDLSRME